MTQHDEEDTVKALHEIVERLDPPPVGLIETTQIITGLEIELRHAADDD